ncbi:MAG: prepilin-type N-terminal cleavage/methylation domain-containing protein [Candidatus Binatia bacterium]
MNPNSEHRAGGFTLLELLLAIVILGLLLTTVYGTLSRTEWSKRIAEERAELFSSGRQAVLKMAGDIEAALPPPAGDRIYFRGTPDGVPEIHLINMNRGGYGVNRVRPGRSLVVYSLDPLPRRRGQHALRREEYLYAKMLAEADGVESAPTEEEEEAEVQAPTEQATYLLDCPDLPNDLNLPGACLPVTALAFRYFDETVGDWRDEWDTTVEPTLGRLPAAVEISLVIADEDGGEHDFNTIVDLPLSRGQPTPRPGQAQTVGGGDGGDPQAGAGEGGGQQSQGRR